MQNEEMLAPKRRKTMEVKCETWKNNETAETRKNAEKDNKR